MRVENNENETISLLYSNRIRIHYAFGEFLLDFGMETPENDEPEYGVRIVLTPFIMKTLRDHLSKVIEDYEKDFAIIKEPPAPKRGVKKAKK